MLLLDVSMPNADGLSVCRRLRAQGDDTPVLMLTARHEVHDRVAGLDAGADDYVVKPFASTNSSPGFEPACAAPPPTTSIFSSSTTCEST